MASVPPFVIIGAGVSGLLAANIFESAGAPFIVFEACDRVGGRTKSVAPIVSNECQSDSTFTPQTPSIDLGAAWVWPDAGVRRIGDSPHNYADARRLAWGMESIAHGLAQRLPTDSLRLNSSVKAVDFSKSHQTTVTLDDGEQVVAQGVIIAMPPRIASKIQFTPALPSDLGKKMSETPTWMAPHAKFFAVYDTPFWRKKGLSGGAFSHVGPLSEIEDQSAEDESFGALFGFFHADAAERSKLGDEGVKREALAQLVRIFGSEAESPTSTVFFDWATNERVATAEDIENPPQGHPLYGGRLFEKLWYDGRLAIAGSETSTRSGGLVEGAVLAGERAATLLLRSGFSTK